MRTTLSVLPLLLSCAFGFSAHAKSPQAQELPYQPLATINTPEGEAVQINFGGFGSDAAKHPSNPKQFYALTDRGPNLDTKGKHGKGKIFPVPEFTPSIGLFEFDAQQKIRLVKTIALKDPSGKKITGLPNPSGIGGTLEVPYNLDGTVITQNPKQAFDPKTNPIRYEAYGLDSEGLVALKDGSFWISDEYGPHIVHFNAQGVEIGRINPFKTDARTQHNLPAEFANRRPNRGMEGLAITPDESTLVGIMQSALSNPNKAAQKSDLTRIVTIDLKTGKTKQYLYPQEIAENANSGLLALSANQFLVIERDGQFALQNPKAMKHVYQIDLSQATDLNSIKDNGHFKQDAQLGLLIDGQTLEQYRLNHSWDEFTKLGIRTAPKKLVADLVKSLNYPHDKFEGMWLLNDKTLAVINDDDFSVWSNDNQAEPKHLDAKRQIIDHNTVYTIPVHIKK